MRWEGLSDGRIYTTAGDIPVLNLRHGHIPSGTVCFRWPVAASGADRSAGGRGMLGGVYTELTYETRGEVGMITLNRPEARNALTHTTYDELRRAVETTTARCLVITGTDPAFCSGDDVKQIMVAAGPRPLRHGSPPRRGSRPPRRRCSAPTCP